MVLAQRQKYRSMEQNRAPKDKFMHLWTPYLWQRRQEYTMEKRQSLKWSWGNRSTTCKRMKLKRFLREGSGTPLQYSCLENPMDGGAWWAAVHGVAKSRTQLSDFTLHFHALEKEMATHSGVLAWRIPGTGEPGGLPSLGSHRVGHDWSDLAAAIAHFLTPYTKINSK